MTQVRTKLIEHSLPLDAINAAAEYEKKLKVGKPLQIHHWWARRPITTCRALVFAQIVDDPSGCPEEFPTEEKQDRERRRLHKVIEEMVAWPKSSDSDQRRFKKAIEAARVEIARSVARSSDAPPPDYADPGAVLDFLQEHAPPVHDPFSGGGSIPLEAQRLGLRAYGSDLNPIPVLITKALIEFPPKFAGLAPVHPDAGKDGKLIRSGWSGAQGLAEDVRLYGQWMRDEAERRIGHLYPKVTLSDGSEATVVAWLWARTVASPDPSQKGAHVPLASSFVLSTKAGKEAIARPVLDPSAPSGWRFIVKNDAISKQDIVEAKRGTKAAAGSNFVCVLSGAAINGKYIKSEGQAGRLGARLMAVVADSGRGRAYLEANFEHESLANTDRPVTPDFEHPVPERLTGGTCFSYGLDQFDKLFTARQISALTTLSDLIGEARDLVLKDAMHCEALSAREFPQKPLSEGGVGPVAYADAVATYLALALSRVADWNNSLCRWENKVSVPQQLFGRQSMPMLWDYAEANPIGDATGSFAASVKNVSRSLDVVVSNDTGPGFSFLKDASSRFEETGILFSTDPPYYDNISYADLSDFFYLWLRRSIKNFHPELFRRVLTPKNEELVAKTYLHKSKEEAEDHFIRGMGSVMSNMAKASDLSSPVAIFYAFKQSEVALEGVLSPGWAAFLQAVVNAGLRVDGTWPVRTEMASRMVASGKNALAASVILVCRKRAEEAPAINRREFLRELRPVMEEAIEAHQRAGVPLPDRRQAAIGPGIGVFSKYSLVREVDDSPMSVATALALINNEIDQILSEGSEDLDPETRFALEWFELHGYGVKNGKSGDAIAQLQAFNLTENTINASGLFRARHGDAGLLMRGEMEADWTPSRDPSFTIWELAQHLARTLDAEDGGLDACGRLLAEKPAAGPDVLLVAERLFHIATKGGDNDEALVWNRLQTSWPMIEEAADRALASGSVSPAAEQMDLL